MNQEYAKSIQDTSNMVQQQKHSINQQYSSSTDEGCETDHGGKKSIVQREPNSPKTLDCAIKRSRNLLGLRIRYWYGEILLSFKKENVLEFK